MHGNFLMCYRPRMNIQALEQAMLRAVIFEIAVGIAVLVLLFWATYWVIKAGVRDGITEAMPRMRNNQRPSPPHGYEWRLTRIEATGEDMRAD